MIIWVTNLLEDNISKKWKLIFGIVSIITSTILSGILTPYITSLVVFVFGIEKDKLSISPMLVGALTLLFNFIFELIYVKYIKVLDSSLTSTISESNKIKLKAGEDADVEWHILFTGSKVYKSEKSISVEFPEWLDITVKGNRLLKNDKMRPNKYSVCLDKLIDNEVTFIFSITPKILSSRIISIVHIKDDKIFFLRRKKIRDMEIIFTE